MFGRGGMSDNTCGKTIFSPSGPMRNFTFYNFHLKQIFAYLQPLPRYEILVSLHSCEFLHPIAIDTFKLTHIVDAAQKSTKPDAEFYGLQCRSR